ncbi:MAG: hypothetical protein AAGF98_05425 [Cyanobacteria bacterium P01_H01_bin.153]
MDNSAAQLGIDKASPPQPTTTTAIKPHSQPRTVLSQLYAVKGIRFWQRHDTFSAPPIKFLQFPFLHGAFALYSFSVRTNIL